MNNFFLEIRDFKCFKKCSIPIKQLTVFTGGNGNGKSTAIQALLYLRRTVEHCASWNATSRRYDLKQPNGLNVELNGPYCLNLGRSINVLNIDSQSDIVSLGVRLSQSPNSYFTIDYSINDGNTLWLTPQNISNNLPESFLNAQEFYYLNAERQGPRLNQDTHFYDYPNVGFHGEYTAQILSACNYDAVEESRSYKQFLEGVRLQHYVNSWLRYILDGLEITSYTDPVSQISRMEISNRFSKEANVLPTNTGFGITYVLPIIVTGLLAPKGRLFIVENPEAHLHPAAQSRIGYFLAQIAGCGVNVVVETHSDHVLNGMQLAVAASLISPEDVSINYLSIVEREVRVQELSVLPTGEISQWPKGFFDQSQLDYLALMNKVRHD